MKQAALSDDLSNTSNKRHITFDDRNENNSFKRLRTEPGQWLISPDAFSGFDNAREPWRSQVAAMNSTSQPDNTATMRIDSLDAYVLKEELYIHDPTYLFLENSRILRISHNSLWAGLPPPNLPFMLPENGFETQVLSLGQNHSTIMNSSHYGHGNCAGPSIISQYNDLQYLENLPAGGVDLVAGSWNGPAAPLSQQDILQLDMLLPLPPV